MPNEITIKFGANAKPEDVTLFSMVILKDILRSVRPVSYTHLTLPTNREV